jgi:pimeloyl-ACP methyl ester carboxylesterase
MVAIVCLHGLLSTPAVWDRVETALGRPVVRPALPDSDDFEGMADTIAAALPERCLLVGHSLGGYLALSVQARAPDRVAGLALVSATAAADPDRQRAIRRKVVAWAQGAGIDALAESLADTLLAETRRGDAELRGMMLAMARETGLDTFARHQAAIASRPDRTGRLAGIACPLLAVTGAEDTVTPPEAGRAMAEAAPRGSFRLLDGVGHMAPLEAPEAVAEEIAALSETLKAEAAG